VRSFTAASAGTGLDMVYGVEFTPPEGDAPKPGFRACLSTVMVRPMPGNFLILASGADYVDPGAATCASLAGFVWRHSDALVTGRREVTIAAVPRPATNSIINSDNQVNGLFSAKFRFADNMTAYTQLLYGRSEPTYSGGLPAWSTNLVTGNVGGYIWDRNTKRRELLQRIFSPDEIGGWKRPEASTSTPMRLNGSLGLKRRLRRFRHQFTTRITISRRKTTPTTFSYNGSFANQMAAQLLSRGRSWA